MTNEPMAARASAIGPKPKSGRRLIAAVSEWRTNSGQRGTTWQLQSPDRMTVRDGTAFHIDNVLGQPELSRNRNGDGGERLVDFDPLDVADLPTCALQRLMRGEDGTEPVHAGLHSANAVGHEPRHRL